MFLIQKHFCQKSANLFNDLLRIKSKGLTLRRSSHSLGSFQVNEQTLAPKKTVIDFFLSYLEH